MYVEEWGAEREGPAGEDSPRRPSFVMLHGLLFDGGMWRSLLPALSELGRVLVVDGPGHGKSERSPRFSLEEHTEALVDLLDELDVERAILVGHSWGGMLAMRLALAHPSRVAALALLDTSAEETSRSERLRYRALIGIHRRVGFPMSLYLSRVAPLMFGPRARREQPALVEEAHRRAMGFDREGLARAATAVVVERSSVLGRLGEVRVPTLVVCGSADAATTLPHSERIAEKIPGARLAVLDELGHMAILENPDAVGGEVLPFLRGCL